VYTWRVVLNRLTGLRSYKHYIFCCEQLASTGGEIIQKKMKRRTVATAFTAFYPVTKNKLWKFETNPIFVE
jgi:hypothetical protein